MNNTDIRKRAEELFEEAKDSGSNPVAAEDASLVEELQIHQIELEIQNEELLQTRDQLEASRNNYASLFNESPLCYVILDENGIIKKANQTFVETLGGQRSTTIGVPLSTFIDDESKAIFLGKYRSFFKKGGEFANTLKLNADDEPHFFTITGRKRIDEDGNEELLLVMSDVTESKTYQEKLVETNRELEKFTYRVSHDLNNQARQMRSFCKLLEKAKPDEVEELTSFIVNLSDEINTIVNGLLNLSRSTSYEIHRSKLNISIMAEDILRIYVREDPERDVVVDIEPDIELFADSNLVKIMLTNLLSNAWKFTRYTENARITVGSKETDSGLAVFIEDNGAGIDSKYIVKLFDTFTRFHSPDKFEGSGIGLATVKRIVERHGGRIWVDTEPGKGATFFFTM